MNTLKYYGQRGGIFSLSNIESEYPDFATSDFMESHYNHLQSYPEDPKKEWDPLISVYSVRESANEDLPKYICIFSTVYDWQPVFVQDIVGLYKLIQEFLPLIEYESKRRSIKSPRQ